MYYNVLITRGKEGRKEGRKEEGIGVNVLIGKRKEDVEVEEVKEGRVAAEDYCRRRRVDRGRCARRGVHSFDAWMSRAVAPTRPPSPA